MAESHRRADEWQNRTRDTESQPLRLRRLANVVSAIQRQRIQGVIAALRIASTPATRAADAVSIESARSRESAAHPETHLGKRCQVLYIDASETVRQRRPWESVTQVQERDRERRRCGADRIAFFVDHLVVRKLNVPTTLITRELPTPARDWFGRRFSVVVADRCREVGKVHTIIARPAGVDSVQFVGKFGPDHE